MAKRNILAVDDEDDIRELLHYNLTREGYEVTCVASGEDALKIIETILPDLVLLDLMLPGIDGLEVCRRLKYTPRTAAIPVIILSAKGSDADVVSGLELGAEDYIVKPFSPSVLCARARAALRRREAAPVSPAQLLEFGSLTIDPVRFEAASAGTQLTLTSTEFKILHFLAARPGCVFTRSQIVTAVHGEKYPVTDRSIDVQIVNLRKKLGVSGDLIETIRGVGYRFKSAR